MERKSENCETRAMRMCLMLRGLVHDRILKRDYENGNDRESFNKLIRNVSAHALCKQETLLIPTT